MRRMHGVEDFVEDGLDKMNSFGEFVGKSLGSMGRVMQKVLIGIGVLMIFGAAIFIWAMISGMLKNRKK